MNQPLRLLMVDDSEDDALLLAAALRRGGIQTVHTLVDTPTAMRAALESQDWDLITSDHAMPCFSAPAALTLAKQIRPDVPFIIVSGEIDLNLAVSLMRAGAWDYVQKSEMARAVPAVERALREVQAHRERHKVRIALEASETRYRRLFETAQDGILILDAVTGQIMDINPFLINMLGYSKEACLGKELWEIGAFRDIDASKAAFKDLQRDGYVRYEDLPLKTRGGKTMAVEFVSNIYSIDDTKVAQCNIRDISARKLAETEIRRLNIDLERRVQERTSQLKGLNQELEAFSFSVSHDLRAPLRRIDGFAETLQEDHAEKQTAETLRLIHSIRASVDRMNALIEALLKLARFSHGGINRNPIDLSAIARGIAANLQEGDPARRVKFSIAEGVKAMGDGQLLTIALENLMGNAWKFTTRIASPHIEFGTAPDADGGVSVFVRDNGAGFDMTYANKLFGAFQRLHSEQEFPGIGVGLATTQRIIQRHKGRIWAESTVNEGATFSFSLGEAQA